VIDASMSRITRPVFAQFRDELGIKTFIQCLWTGGYAQNEDIRRVAAPNLADAFDEGYEIAGYTNVSPWYEVAMSLFETKRNAGVMWDHLSLIPIDLELAGIQPQAVKETITRLDKPTLIYTGLWWWNPWIATHDFDFSDQRGWIAFYDNDPDRDVHQVERLGKIIGEQYKGSTTQFGVDVDFSFFERIEEWPMPDTSEILLRLEKLEHILFVNGLSLDTRIWQSAGSHDRALMPLVWNSRKRLPKEVVLEWYPNWNGK